MKTNRTVRRGRSGFTMIEVMIATLILSAIVLMSYTILFSTTKTEMQGQLNNQLEARGKQAAMELRQLFYDAHFSDLTSYLPNNAVAGTFKPEVGIHDNGTQIHFQVVLTVDANGSVAYGFPVAHVDPNNPREYQGYSCIIRFEPETVLYEGAGPAPAVVQPTTADDSAPSWRPNSNTGKALAPGQVLPSKSLNTNIYGDISTSPTYKTHVYVQGKIWKYVMNPFPYVNGLPPDQNIVQMSRVSDNVILGVGPGGIFNADVDLPVSNCNPAPPTATQKDWLFRFLMAEPSPSFTYGCTDLSIPAVQTYPSANSVAVGFTIWHLVQDEQAKGIYKHKTWEKIPFRLSH